MGFSSEKELQKIRDLVCTRLSDEPVTVILFGSRATGEENPGSYVDIGLIPHGDVHPRIITLLREELEESTIPYIVEFVDLSKTSETFRKKALLHYQIWKK